MVLKAQVASIPPENLLYSFKFMENAPYRYYNAETEEFSAPGYLAIIVNIIEPGAELASLSLMGYEVALDGTVDVLVLDRKRCNITQAMEELRKIALRMN